MTGLFHSIQEGVLSLFSCQGAVRGVGGCVLPFRLPRCCVPFSVMRRWCPIRICVGLLCVGVLPCHPLSVSTCRGVLGWCGIARPYYHKPRTMSTWICHSFLCVGQFFGHSLRKPLHPEAMPRCQSHIFALCDIGHPHHRKRGCILVF